jgi:hypothetical protein
VQGSRFFGWSLLAAAVALAACSMLCFGIHYRNNVYLLKASAFIFDAPGDDESKAIALAHFVAREGMQAVQMDAASTMARLEHRLPLELSPVTVLKEGFAFTDARRFGPCGQLSRTIRAIALLRHIPAHKVLLDTDGNEHAMVTMSINGADRLFDPTYDFYWTDRSGHVATFDEVRRDPEIFRQIYGKVPWYRYRLDGATFFRWSRLGAPGLWLQRALTSLVGPARVERVDTPVLYDRPWLGYAWVSGIAAVVCLALGVLALRAAGPAAAPATRPAPVLVTESPV